MDRFTRTRIPARYQHNTLDLHVLENVRTSLALYLPPLFDFSVYVRTYVHRVGINREQSGNMETAAVRLYIILEHNYSLVILLYIIWI